MMNNMNSEFLPEINPAYSPSLLQNKTLASSLGIRNATLMKGTADK